MPRQFFHCLCVLLLLVAQQGALVHATWHASGDARGHAAHEHESHAHDQDTDHEAPAGQGSLCAFDLAFGQVLGGVYGACALQLVTTIPVSLTVYPLNPRVSAEAITALSRGPPALL